MVKGKKRIVYICDDLMLGGWTSLRYLILELKRRERFEISVVTLFGKGYNAEILEKNGINVFCLNLNPFNLPVKLLQLICYLLRNSPDIVHTNLHYSDIFGIICAYLARVRKKIIHLHSVQERYRHKLYILKKISAKLADAISAVSNAAAEDFRKELNDLQKEIRIIPNCIDVCEFRKRVECSWWKKSDFGILENETVVLTVANFKWQKGYEYLVGAAEILRDKNFKFLLVGYGPELKKIKNLVEKKSLTEKVIFLGPRTDVPEVMKVADFFLLPSLAESFGICLLEAFAARLPVIACAVDGIIENLENKVDSILVKPADSREIAEALLLLSQDKELCRHILENADKKLLRFDVKNIADLFEEFYNE